MRDRLVIGLHHPGLLLGVDVELEAGVSRRDERVRATEDVSRTSEDLRGPPRTDQITLTASNLCISADWHDVCPVHPQQDADPLSWPL